mmetsp:Transcript_5208/g.10973  ORF Transcript_5208/g.10973 Transcript_5208/m.10973 type:complete len:346 (+) Transcript_5208:1012-2049(+)
MVQRARYAGVPVGPREIDCYREVQLASPAQIIHKGRRALWRTLGADSGHGHGYGDSGGLHTQDRSDGERRREGPIPGDGTHRRHRRHRQTSNIRDPDRHPGRRGPVLFRDLDPRDFQDPGLVLLQGHNGGNLRHGRSGHVLPVDLEDAVPEEHQVGDGAVRPHLRHDRAAAEMVRKEHPQLTRGRPRNKDIGHRGRGGRHTAARPLRRVLRLCDRRPCRRLLRLFGRRQVGRFRPSENIGVDDHNLSHLEHKIGILLFRLQQSLHGSLERSHGQILAALAVIEQFDLHGMGHVAAAQRVRADAGLLPHGIQIVVDVLAPVHHVPHGVVLRLPQGAHLEKRIGFPK